MPTRGALKKILTDFRPMWDHEGTRPIARATFKKALDCGTAALGAEVYASDIEHRIVYHTCKSKACSSCGHRATVLWQREQWAALPDVPYREITFTMPNQLWPLFRDNRALLRDLSTIGAKAIQCWIRNEHAAEVGIMVVAHTFGRHLNFNSHLHILVTAGGLRRTDGAWVPRLKLRKASLGEFWRNSLISHLRLALRHGKLKSSQTIEEVEQLLSSQSQRDWVTDHKEVGSKDHFLRYAARYLRRPPVAEYRFRSISDQEIVFRTNDHKQGKEVLTRYSPADFLQALSDQVPDRYRNSVRYFGLFAPRTKAQCQDTVFMLLGQRQRPRPARLPWALSLKRDFGIDPLLDSQGRRMQLVARRAPARG